MSVSQVRNPTSPQKARASAESVVTSSNHANRAFSPMMSSSTVAPATVRRGDGRRAVGSTSGSEFFFARYFRTPVDPGGGRSSRFGDPPREAPMQYLLLIYEDEKNWTALSEAE